MSIVRGLISNIERFAIHDGPGIRTLVFMKGCPLRCRWCSSPQTWNRRPEILHDAEKCLGCGTCIDSCPASVFSLSGEGSLLIDRERCDGCGECSQVCPNGALEYIGRYVTPEELLQEVIKDSAFYRRSGGGVTVGGGEPTLQMEFLSEFYKICWQRGIHTSIETCGYFRWEKFEQVLPYLNLIHMDLKHMDDVRHRELTGVSNRTILENAIRIAERKPLIFRVPVVPGCNDDEDNIRATARFAADLGPNLLRIDLLPYHKLGSQTYSRLGLIYPLEETEPLPRSDMERLQAIVQSYYGIPVEID
jgi:pyruvate formate lyase activating enzyme